MLQSEILNVCEDYLEFCPLIDNRYRLLKSIGMSRFGKVYLAMDLYHNRLVALKRLKQIHSNRIYLKMFLNEMLNLSKLQQGGQALRVCNILDFNLNGVYKDNRLIVYYVMEYKEMGDLFSLVESMENLLSVDLVVHFQRQLYQALSEIHTLGIVHLDIKPDNIVLDEQLRLYLCDFGHSIDISQGFLSKSRNSKKMLSKKRIEELRQTSFVGSIEYAAPEILELQQIIEEGSKTPKEIAENLREIDLLKCDVFGSGVTLFIQHFKNFPFSKAEKEDLYFRTMLNNPENFWKSFETVRSINSDFIDVFSKSCAIGNEKRLNVKNLLDHPWLTDNGFDFQEDLYGEMREWINAKRKSFLKDLVRHLKEKKYSRNSRVGIILYTKGQTR